MGNEGRVAFLTSLQLDDTPVAVLVDLAQLVSLIYPECTGVLMTNPRELAVIIDH